MAEQPGGKSSFGIFVGGVIVGVIVGAVAAAFLVPMITERGPEFKPGAGGGVVRPQQREPFDDRKATPVPQQPEAPAQDAEKAAPETPAATSPKTHG